MTLVLLALLFWAFTAAPWSWALQPDHFEWYQLWTAPLLHADVEHLLSNCVAITLTGVYFERRFGKLLFVLFILLACTLSMGAEYLQDPSSINRIVGASGLAFALIGVAACQHWSMQVGFLSIILYPFFYPPSQLTALHAHLAGYLFGVIWGAGSHFFDAFAKSPSHTRASTLSKPPDQTSHAFRRARD